MESRGAADVVTGGGGGWTPGRWQWQAFGMSKVLRARATWALLLSVAAAAVIAAGRWC